MSSGYTLRYALDVALEGESLSDHSAIICTPIIFNEILRQSKEELAPSDMRATPENLERAMENLLERVEFSRQYNFMLNDLGKAVSEGILKSRPLVAGILAWDRLKEDQRKSLLHTVLALGSNHILGKTNVKIYAEVHRDLVQPEMLPFTKKTKLVDTVLRPTYMKMVDGSWQVTMNSHPAVDVMIEPYGALQEIFASIIQLHHQAVRELDPSTNQSRLIRHIGNDHSNLKLQFNENASVPPALPSFYEKQFDVASAVVRAAIFASELEKQITQKGQSILNTNNIFAKIDTLMTYGTFNP